MADRIPLAFSSPAGLSTEPTEFEMLARNWTGFQPISAAFRIACAANFGDASLKKMSAPKGFQCDDLTVDGWVRGLVGDFADNHARCCLGAEAILEAFEIIAARIVILVEDSDLALGVVLQDVLGIDPPSVW